MLKSESGSANIPRTLQVKTMDFKARIGSVGNLRANLVSFEDSLQRTLKPKFIVQKHISQPDKGKLPENSLQFLHCRRQSSQIGFGISAVGKHSLLTVGSTQASPSITSHAGPFEMQSPPDEKMEASTNNTGPKEFKAFPREAPRFRRPPVQPYINAELSNPKTEKVRHKKVHSLTPVQLTKILNVNYQGPQKLAPEELESLVRGVGGDSCKDPDSPNSRALTQAVQAKSECNNDKSPSLFDTPALSRSSSKKVNFSSNVLVWRYIKHQEEY